MHVYRCNHRTGEWRHKSRPGAPLGKIDIKVKKTEWYAPGLGLVKLIREEISDSETMGNIYYEKVMNFD